MSHQNQQLESLLHFICSRCVQSICSPEGDLIINPSAIHRARKDNCVALAAEIREFIDPKVRLTVHWDGKIMPDVTGKGRGCVDRLPIMVHGKDMTKLLAILKL